jgi:hypothetical protein
LILDPPWSPSVGAAVHIFLCQVHLHRHSQLIIFTAHIAMLSRSIAARVASSATQRRFQHTTSSGSQTSNLQTSTRSSEIFGRQHRIRSMLNSIKEANPSGFATLKQMASSGSFALGDAANIRRTLQTIVSSSSKRTILASYVLFPNF